jgi:hypothetical protein
MTSFGGGNYEQQARVAAESGSGGPAYKPSGGDKRSTLVLVAALVIFVGAVFLIAQ